MEKVNDKEMTRKEKVVKGLKIVGTVGTVITISALAYEVGRLKISDKKKTTIINGLVKDNEANKKDISFIQEVMFYQGAFECVKQNVGNKASRVLREINEKTSQLGVGGLCDESIIKNVELDNIEYDECLSLLEGINQMEDILRKY